MDPRAQEVFSFGEAKLTDAFFKSPRLVRHAKYFVEMIEKSIGLLGPDIELLTDVLLELGKKHVDFGVQASMYPPMGRALIETIEELLGDKFTRETKEAWLEIFQALSYDMIRARNIDKQ